MRAALVAGALVVAGLAACASDPGGGRSGEVGGGDPARGAEVVAASSCGTCHEVPGVRGADGRVGPPLAQFARRSTIAGRQENEAVNLQRWLLDPQSIDPRTAMPDVGLTPAEARDVAAFLYTLD